MNPSNTSAAPVKPRRIWIDPRTELPPFLNAPISTCPNCGGTAFGQVVFADNSGNKGMSRAGWILFALGVVTACLYVGFVFMAIGLVMIVASFIQSPKSVQKGIECLRCQAAWRTD